MTEENGRTEWQTKTTESNRQIKGTDENDKSKRLIKRQANMTDGNDRAKRLMKCRYWSPSKTQQLDWLADPLDPGKMVPEPALRPSLPHAPGVRMTRV